MSSNFSNYFGINEELLDQYGALDISLIADLPLFIDPFLLFNSSKKEYQDLHEGIIGYLAFLKQKAVKQSLSEGDINNLYRFKEVKQNWLGFSIEGNKGSALGEKFARGLYKNLHRIFSNFGEEVITKSSHLEKLCLIQEGVGKDNISDFATNLIKEFLLEYTQKFALKNIDSSKLKKFRVTRVKFNYETEMWQEATYTLPNFGGDYVLLTPKEILTKDEAWINKKDLFEEYDHIPYSISNEQIRSGVNNYFEKCLKGVIGDDKRKPTKKEKNEAILKTIREYPDLIDYFIKFKESKGDLAKSVSEERVSNVLKVFIENVKSYSPVLEGVNFFENAESIALDEARRKVQILKHEIENGDLYKIFYDKDSNLIRREEDIQLLFKLLTSNSTLSDVNREPNNGRGPVDFKLSIGNRDKALVEFKLASNTKLEKNLQNQVQIYEAANRTSNSIKVIIFYSDKEMKRVQNLLKKLGLQSEPDIVTIDARPKKVSASNV